MSMRSLVVLSFAALSCGCSTISSTRPASASAAVPATSATISVVIGVEHAAIIRAYYDDGSLGQGRGPGRARGRNGGLPPGIAMNLQRGKPLPPGIAKQTLPREILVQLPPLPSGLEYAVVAGKLLLIDIATHVVHDVLVDVLFD